MAFWLLVGGLAGWQATILVRAGGKPELVLNIGVGIFGAVIGGWLYTGPFGTASISGDAPSFGGFIAAALGSFLLVTLLRLARGSAPR